MPQRAPVRAALKLLRPKQWTKNLLVFAALLFSGSLTQVPLVERSLLAFASFCLLSGAVYVINDLADMDTDREHPKKRRRPLAAGEISVRGAVITAVASLILAVVVAWPLGSIFLGIAAVYFGLVFAYSLWWKHVVVVDILVVAVGFVLRAAAGAAAIQVSVSPWLLICTFFLAVFLTVSRRRHEYVLLGCNGGQHRSVLDNYTLPYLDQVISIVTSTALVTYTLYTVKGTDHQYLVVTLPFVVFGVFRYLYLVHCRQEGGSPEDILLGDVPILVTVLGWVIVSGIVIYGLPSWRV